MMYDIVSAAMKAVFLVCVLLVNFTTEKKRSRIAQGSVLGIILVFLEVSETGEERIFILLSLVEVCFLYMYTARWNPNKGSINLSVICLLELVYEVISMVSAVGANLMGWMVGMELGENVVPLYLLMKFLLLYFLLRSRYRFCFKGFSMMTELKKWTIVFIYGIFMCIKLPLLFTNIEEGKALKAVILTMLISVVFFLLISGHDRRKINIEKAKIEADNQRLSAQLHKSREILPAVAAALEKITLQKGVCEINHARELLSEVYDLYKFQTEESKKDDLFLKSFGSTGLQLLDMQLLGYLQEAAEKGINLDIFIPEPIDEILKQKGINRLNFQRAIGDMVRNSFNAVREYGGKKKEILLIIGYGKEGAIEISVMDNGIAFPGKVLENFGKRGISIGGTGNGLADLAEFRREERASLILTQYDKEEGTFTKNISLIFDERDRMEIRCS